MQQPEQLRTGNTSLLEVRGDEYVYGQFSLRVVRGPDEGREVVPTNDEATVGTEAGCDLVMSDRAVSRHHCSIRVTDAGLELRDLGSTNGTVLGGYPVGSAIVEPGALIGVGRSVVRVELTGREVRESLSERIRFGAALGHSPSMRRVFAVLERFAASDGTVLLEGETGTGKGVLAEAIHGASPRADGPFVVVDCGAIPPTLIEAELFGHVRGAYTGATETRRGAFESARGGTVFLDEVGELPASVQPVLLRALEERSIKRVGDDARLPIDVRVVAATNRDLRQEVNEKRFRADLFYRLAVLRIRVPSLRERREDVPMLVRHFWEHFTATEPAGARPVLPDDMVTALSAQRWPGNVRQLRSAVQRALLVGDAEDRWGWPDGPGAREVSEADARYDLAVTYGEVKERAVLAWEAEYVKRLLAAHGNNLSRAARSVGMSRNHLRVLAQRCGLRDAEG
ncbi:MAG TPA: sigma 54-interacting transcriptional regulator [Kofleriaceae bacterium]|nr:sigma 54-interacting transcriptional regulator [Kofleriaceae bacterium]